MKRNRKLALALVLGLALLTLSGCDGTEGGTIDYIDGHWVFTSAQTEQQTDITQLLASPDAFYGAASAMTDEELQRSFDRLSPGQCAQIFSALGEHRAMALASRLTQTQVERLLAALQGQSEIPTEPAALAAIWQTLTTEEQLSALGGLSSADYAALWALLDGATPSPVPDAALPEETAAPDMTDPVYLAGIWHTLTQQEQSAVLSGLSSTQFVSLWSLLDAQGGTASDAPIAAEDTAEAAPSSAADGMANAEQTPAPQESAPAQEPEAGHTASPDAERTDSAGLTDPATLADAWYTLSPQEQLSAVAALTADQFVSLQELLSVRPRPTPAEEDTLFIPTPKPTAKPTPVPTPAPTAMPDETESEPAAPDFSDPAVLAGIWPALSPEEQLSILSALTTEQYIALQELLARLPNTGGSIPADTGQAGDTTPAEKPAAPDEATGDTSTPKDDPPAADPDAPDEATGDESTPEDESPAANPDAPDEATGDESTPEGEPPAADPDAPDEATGDESTPEDESPAADPDESFDESTSENEPSAADPDEADETTGDDSVSEDGSAPFPEMPGQLPPDLMAWPAGEATPSEALPIPGQPNPTSLDSLSRILKRTKP